MNLKILFLSFGRCHFFLFKASTVTLYSWSEVCGPIKEQTDIRGGLDHDVGVQAHQTSHKLNPRLSSVQPLLLGSCLPCNAPEETAQEGASCLKYLKSWLSHPVFSAIIRFISNVKITSKNDCSVGGWERAQQSPEQHHSCSLLPYWEHVRIFSWTIKWRLDSLLSIPCFLNKSLY